MTRSTPYASAPVLAACFGLAALVVTPSASAGGEWDVLSVLTSESGWESVTTKKHKDAGLEIEVKLKYVNDKPCLQGVAKAEPTPETLLAVAGDILGSKQWSSAGLSDSRVLANNGGVVDYYQMLDVPGWTLASDRFWVLSGRKKVGDNGAQRFQWIRKEWRSRYPDLASELDRDHSGAVEPPINYGEWRFTPQADGTTEVRYYACTDTGGSLPESVQKAAAKQTLPDNVADIVIEARKRSK